jgi:hypothetical protein
LVGLVLLVQFDLQHYSRFKKFAKRKTCRNMSPHPNLLPTGEKELKDIESAMIVWDPEIG